MLILSACASPLYDSSVNTGESTMGSEIDYNQANTTDTDNAMAIPKEPVFFGEIHAHGFPTSLSSPNKGFSPFFYKTDYRSIYFDGFFYPAPALNGVYRFCTTQDRQWNIQDIDGQAIPPDPARHLDVDGVFIRPTLYGYIVVKSGESVKLIDRDTGAVLRRIDISQDTRHPFLYRHSSPEGASKWISDVTSDLSALLYIRNGVFLMEYPGTASRQIMPEGYRYLFVRFANNERLVMANRVGEGIDGTQLVSHDMESGEFRVVLEVPNPQPMMGVVTLWTLNYWAIHYTGFYDIRQDRFVEVNLPLPNDHIFTPSPYIVSYKGLVYFFDNTGNLMEFDPQTGQQIFTGYSMEKDTGWSWWMESDCPNSIIAYVSGVYRFEVGR